MAYQTLTNAAEELSLWGGTFDLYRNAREITWQSLGTGFMRVTGILVDDGNIPADQPRPRVHSIPFSVVVPEGISLDDLQQIIWQETRRFA
jgi:hypothetical protein